MHRRSFVKLVAGSAACCAGSGALFGPYGARAASAESRPASRALLQALADAALGAAKRGGASYADVRLCQDEAEWVASREERIESIGSSRTTGFGVRLLLEGAWGFAASDLLTPEEAARMAAKALDIARANRAIQQTPIELEEIPARQDKWVMPMRIDPFTVSVEEKTAKLLAINAIAKKAGASFCASNMEFVRETKFFASSGGSLLEQVRVRSMPGFDVTVVDKKTGKFANRSSLAAPRGSGYEYVTGYDFDGEAHKAAEEAHGKLTARPVEPGKKDLVLHPTNLWLTIHESIGHATELDRALGWEANFAGTSFVTPDKLGKLQYGSPHITVMADRSQEGGLATIGYDDDGVKTTGAEFPIIQDGIFRNYQMAIGQAALIGLKQSNGCAYADSYGSFPLQRMPNVSLQPAKEDIGLDELLSGVKDGIFIMGNGSWSIDQQRKNFQFGGQVFYEIKDGKLGAMLRDVAYQGNTVEFWNACDGVCGRSEYFLGGARNCGKGQPAQSAPVSHGAVPARFRQINVINTAVS